jgi:L-ascorbate metabolism protein UlaG (beta-lactamase superfamily)
VIRVTFLGHSGFLAELPGAALLFDWWKGELPALPEVPLFCFVSHRHEDHFNPRVFSLAADGRDVTFLLGRDIRLTPRNLERWGLDAGTAAHCVRLGGGETWERDGLAVEALPSTDQGVAFAVSRGGVTLYHAGDLNWWHWEEEDRAWNRNMETDFKRALEPLRGRRIDVAFAPLDPRLGPARDWGLRYLLETADVRRVFPMHQWGDFATTGEFCRAAPELAGRVIPVERDGQSWELSL